MTDWLIRLIGNYKKITGRYITGRYITGRYIKMGNMLSLRGHNMPSE